MHARSSYLDLARLPLCLSVYILTVTATVISTFSRYYLKGMRHEKPITDQFKLPLYLSRIRMDPPEIDPVEAEEINRLTDGKLKHLLVGSPSGEWTIETERILSFEVNFFLCVLVCV